jgi:undecaprenyl-diphosphatase
MKLPVASMKSFDIATHFGTLLALLVYFWRDFLGLIQAFFAGIGQIFSKKTLSAETEKSKRLLILLILATIPAIVLAVTLGDWLDEMFRNPISVAISMIIVGVLFFAAELVYSKVKTRNVGFREGIVMGFAQCIALIPGVSRSGITISSGLFQGVKRDEAAKFSFLLGSIAIFGGAVFAVVAVMKGKYAMPSLDTLVAGIASSFLVGLAAISFLMKFLKKHSLHIFGIYRVIFGFVLLYLVNFSSVFSG